MSRFFFEIFCGKIMIIKIELTQFEKIRDLNTKGAENILIIHLCQCDKRK